MDMLICNKCFAPIKRGRKPYNITQCGHVFCQSCLQQAEKKCTQCECNGVISIALKEPLPSNVIPLFAPLAETFDMLLKVDVFRSNQMMITMQRFFELDTKYELLKNHYRTLQQNMKKLIEKYEHLQIAKDKLEKNQLFSQVQRGPAQLSKITTPRNSNIFIHPSSSGYSSGSMGQQSINIKTMQLADDSRSYKSIDGFLMPRKRKTLDSYMKINTSLNSSFK